VNGIRSLESSSFGGRVLDCAPVVTGSVRPNDSPNHGAGTAISVEANAHHAGIAVVRERGIRLRLC
jgi:hypothetical protein